MANILYGKKIIAREGKGIDPETLPEVFSEAAVFMKKLSDAGMRVAHAFIDPLLKGFEAGNQFYFKVLQCEKIDKLNYYRTGAGPVHALHDAKERIDTGFYDAVFIFGYEPLLSIRNHSGKDAIQRAMNDILEGSNIPKIYNGLAEILCREFDLSEESFSLFADALYKNYLRTFSRLHPEENPSPSRGRNLAGIGAPLFSLSDCANPNLDFAGGILVGNDAVASLLGIPEEKRIRVCSVKQTMKEADPEKLGNIAGTKANPFPHLREILQALAEEGELDFRAEFERKKLLLDVYTCYPPIPMAFLLASGLIEKIEDLPAFLEKGEITLTGGMSLGGAPWNNPALHGLVRMWEELLRSSACYGLVHGNGGIGEAQGVALLAKR